MQPKKLISDQPVAFKLKDTVCPDISEMVRAIGPELQVTGNIVFCSDGGDQKNRFAVVEVAGIHTPLIVPVDCLESAVRLVEGRAWQSVEPPLSGAC